YLASVLACASLTGALAATYTVTDLGTGTASDINSSGHVVGTTAEPQAFYYNGAVSHNIDIPLGDLPFGGGPVSATNSQAIAINDSDLVLDTGYYGIGSAVGLYSGATGTHLGYLSLPGPLGINNAGTMVGWGPDGPFQDLEFGKVLFPDGSTYGYGLGEVGDPKSLGFCRLYAINEANLAVGAAGVQVGKSRGSRPFDGLHLEVNLIRAAVFRTNGFEFIDTRDGGTNILDPGLPANHLSDAYSINASGHAVGEMSLTAGSALKHAFRYTGGGLEDLGTLGGTSSSAYDLNATDQVVGTSTTASGEAHAFVWQGGVMTDLNTLLPSGSGWVLTRANAINDLGQIVGTGILNGTAHAFLLSPATLTPAPDISVQPVGKTLALNESYTLSVTAQGGGPLAYQWQHAGTNLPGATNSTFVISSATAFDAGSYGVTVTNTAGNAVSHPAEIIVLDPRLTARSYLGLTVEGAVGASYRIEYQAPPTATWTPLTTLTLTNVSQIYVDFESPDHPQRLYRAVRQP
ncbi:MAG TPA: immunoglobulin domain-containing protein, partial [Candidatus Limnocylindria bacterium]|nr:immunoglobulin domain-containing protein [Candidatus Limnocylindria bacterium]